MSNSESKTKNVKEIWGKISQVLDKIGCVIGNVGLWLYKLRQVFMAVPVVYAAWKLAGMNMEKLPEVVGLNLQSTGEFAMQVTREYAVYGPLGVTAFCLILMFFSRKSLFPWVVSIITLLLPLLIYVSNCYPG